MSANISSAVLAGFLVEAHRKTYANKKAAKVAATRLRSLDYRFMWDDLVYHDTYFGRRDFIGEEIIYRTDTPVWGMNYFGIILASDANEGEVYDFLRDVLSQDCIDIAPARGPRLYGRGNWTYANTVDRTLDDFSGIERIHRDGEPIYRGRYHGGRIA